MVNSNEISESSQSPVRAAVGKPDLFSARAWLRAVLALLCCAAVLFVPAGRWDLPMFWAYWFVFISISAGILALVHRRFPDLLQERYRPGPGARDPRTRPLLVPFIAGHWIVAGLDVGRYRWSGELPVAAQLAGLAIMALGLCGWGWAMLSNRFFSSEVRIQSDRGHTVVSSGPYRFVRHPGYACALFVFGASGLALGSLWAILPAIGIVLIFLRRTKLEDDILRAELQGYAEYAKQVRFRLLPGVW
ncbi:MAG: isoprenylcysteine carboxylmethyltransferase family protein [Acidobacteria bacterium]|nr:isoprenylcysteine carboxylmethyltransferase family protein [Acidobacteriota bacterium]MCL5288248.1 isoprenylcysteine carboxylmethyltransferase family protein [Acidobacteriota bacterium]